MGVLRESRMMIAARAVCSLEQQLNAEPHPFAR